MNVRFFHSTLLLAALSCLLLIAGCSALRLSYGQADVLIAWRANEYFDLNPLQKHDLDTRLERLLAWHRHDQLPEYAALLSAAIERAQPGLKREDLVWFFDGLKERYRTVVNRASDDAAELLTTLAPEQLIALQKQLDKVNRKFVKEREIGQSIERRKRARFTKTLDQIQDWTGSLSYDQQQKIEALLEAIPLYEQVRHADRIRRQQDFLQLLALRGKPQEFRPKLKAWLLDWERGRTPAYVQLSNEVYEKRLAFYLALDKLLTPGQRQIVRHRAREYVDDFKTLAAKPQRASP